MYDGTTRMTLRGETVYHYGTVATMGALTVVPEDCAIPIRKDFPLDKAALIGCSVTTGLCSVLNVGQVPAGASTIEQVGESPLIAAMRAFVASHFGDTVADEAGTH